MTNLSFDTGTYKEYQLNGGETIRINVGDPGIIDRLNGATTKIDELTAKYGADLTPDNVGQFDREMRSLVDGIINCPGACDKAFGSTNCFALAGGQPVIVNFIEVLIKQLTVDMSSFVKTLDINKTIKQDNDELSVLDNERTQKYITQSKPQLTQPSETVQSINLATLSQEERSKLLAELLGEQK